MAFADWFSRKEMRPSATSQSVLLVDDSAFFRNMLAPVLKAAGYRVRVAPNAQEGLVRCARAKAFDVVLTDIEMPDMKRIRIRRDDPGRSALEHDADQSHCPRWSRRGDRARPPRRLPRLRRQVRPPRP